MFQEKKIFDSAPKSKKPNRIDNEQIWQNVLGALEISISKANFTTWFTNTELVSYKNRQAIISVPNLFAKEWLENKYQKLILYALNKAVDERVEAVKYEVVSLKAPTSSDLGSNSNKNKGPYQKSVTLRKEKIDSQTNLNPNYTFDNFIVGSNNELARAACHAVACNPGLTYNPLFIYGGVGLGKTHLLQAVGNEILKRFKAKKVKYITSERFMDELVKAIGKHDVDYFKDRYRSIDVMIIDDIQFIAGREKTQEEFFHTFNTLYGENKQIIISSDRPPKAIPTLEERLSSRFEGGMIADITAPDIETRTAILEHKAQKQGIKLQREALNYIANNIQRNVRELEGALNRVAAHHQLHNTKLTLENIKKILKNVIEIPRIKAVSTKEIINAVIQFYNLNLDELLERSRKQKVAFPRQILMYLLREEGKSSYPSIGQELGGRDHTTVIHAYKKIKREISEKEDLRQEIELIKQKIYS